MKLSHIQIEPTEAGAPAVIPSGVLEYHEDTEKLYKSNGTVKTEIGSGGSGSRRPSWDNPPSSPHAYDDEFDSGTLDAKWTIYSTGTTNPAVAGTIDYTASLTTPIIDVATVPSIMMIQSDNSSSKPMGIYQSYSPSTDATFFTKICNQNINISTNGHSQIGIVLSVSSDTNELIIAGMNHDGAGIRPFIYVENNGAGTLLQAAAYTDTLIAPTAYIVIWKKSNVYHSAWGSDQSGVFSYLGNVTKTGVTTFDRVGYRFLTATNTPSVIEGIDFFRYKASLDYSLVNT